MVDLPICAVKSAFQPPESVRFFVIVTTAPLAGVYVPIATSIVSPAVAFPIAPLIVRRGRVHSHTRVRIEPRGRDIPEPCSRGAVLMPKAEAISIVKRR